MRSIFNPIEGVRGCLDTGKCVINLLAVCPRKFIRHWRKEVVDRIGNDDVVIHAEYEGNGCHSEANACGKVDYLNIKYTGETCWRGKMKGKCSCTGLVGFKKWWSSCILFLYSKQQKLPFQELISSFGYIYSFLISSHAWYSIPLSYDIHSWQQQTLLCIIFALHWLDFF